MTHWNHYIVTEERRVDLSDIKTALQAANPAFQLNGNLIWLPNAEHGKLAYAEVTFEDFATQEATLDIEFFSNWMADKQNEALLLAALNNARSIITIQMLNTGLWWNKEYAQTLAPLQDWLLENREGILYVEGGEFYDRNGLLD